MDQPVRKHKTYRHPAGCYCCQFQDNKWFSTEQNAKLLFRRAIKAVDIAYWHTARVNITYWISFHSELSSGQSTTTDIVELYTALKEFSWMIEKHFNCIFKHITHCILTSYHLLQQQCVTGWRCSQDKGFGGDQAFREELNGFHGISGTPTQVSAAHKKSQGEVSVQHVYNMVPGSSQARSRVLWLLLLFSGCLLYWYTQLPQKGGCVGCTQ